MMPVTIARVRAVLVGGAGPLGSGGAVSAIDKRSAVGPVWAGALGLDGDEQADRRVHGGELKAVHVYPWSHYQRWRAELPDCTVLHAPGAFGENLSVEGIDERDVCLGDRWRVGGVLLEVSQGRQPCWKLNVRFGVADMARRVQDSTRAGWYLRVVQPGAVTAGDDVVLAACPAPSHSLADVLAAIRDREVRPEVIGPMLELPLTPSWRRLLERRVASGVVEDWTSRLDGAGTGAAPERH